MCLPLSHQSTDAHMYTVDETTIGTVFYLFKYFNFSFAVVCIIIADSSIALEALLPLLFHTHTHILKKR